MFRKDGDRISSVSWELSEFLRGMNPEMSVELDDTLPSNLSVLAAVVLSSGFGSGKVSHFHFPLVTHFSL